MKLADRERWLQAYVVATAPLRWYARLRLRRANRMPVVGLRFCRVSDNQQNERTISLAAFDDILSWLQQHADLVSVSDAQALLRHGNNSRVAVHLSFDQGYADNCLHAIPTLLRQQIPFTYFVSSQHVSSGEPFAHDLRIGQKHSPNSIEQIKALAEAGIELGIHTRSYLDAREIQDCLKLEEEIGGARRDILRWTGHRAHHFAFPIGGKSKLDSAAIQFLHDERFRSYASAYGGYNFPFDDAFHLHRFKANRSLAAIKNVVNLDPRWVWAPLDNEYIPFEKSTLPAAVESAG